METASLLLLPVELIHHISRHLSVQDVLSCSLTCHYLRTALNDNSVWKRHLPSDISRLEAQEQQVAPALVIDESLSQFCEYRQHFVRKTHILNNWKEGNFLIRSSHLENQSTNGVLNMNSKGKGAFIQDDKYLILESYMGDNGIHLWDITKDPVIHSSLKRSRNKYQSYFVVGSYLVVVECVVVFVYLIDIAGKDFPLIYSFFITKRDVQYERIEHNCGMYDLICAGWNYSIIRNYLISYKCEGNFIHIWDIANATKVGSFIPPERSFTSIKLNSIIGNKFWFHSVQSSLSSVYLYAFDIDLLLFDNVLMRFDNGSHLLPIFEDCVILLKHKVNGSSDIVCSIYDIKSSLKLKGRCFDNASKRNELDSITIVNGRFVIMCNDGLHVIDALTLETVDLVECDSVRIQKQLVIYESLIVVATDIKHRLELWDINRKTKLPIALKNVNICQLFLDSLFTKLVVNNFYHVKVYHFW